MLKQIEVEKFDTFQITSKHSAFNGSSWQDAYFKVMTYQNTFSFAYQTNIESTRDHEAYLFILLRPDTDKDRITEWLTDLGYGDIKVDRVFVGEMSTYDLDVDFIAEV